MCGKGGKNEQHLMGIVILIVCNGYMVWALCNKRMKVNVLKMKSLRTMWFEEDDC